MHATLQSAVVSKSIVEIGNKGLIISAEISAEVYPAGEIGDLSIKILGADSWRGCHLDLGADLQDTLGAEVAAEICANWAQYRAKILAAL